MDLDMYVKVYFGSGEKKLFMQCELPIQYANYIPYVRGEHISGFLYDLGMQLISYRGQKAEITFN